MISKRWWARFALPILRISFVQATTPTRERACVTEWHSKFHATARDIEATPSKKSTIP
jgi:hypothetical protein